MTWPVDCDRRAYDTHASLIRSVVDNDVSDFLIQVGPDGIVEEALVRELVGHHKYAVDWYDPVMKEQDLERVVNDLVMFHPNDVCVLVIDGGDYITEGEWGKLFGWAMKYDFRVIVNANNIDKIPYRVRVSSIISRFPSYRPPLPTKPKPIDTYWYLNQFVEHREDMAVLDRYLGRKYMEELMRDIKVSTYRKYSRKSGLWSTAKKLRGLTKDSARKIVQHVIPVIKNIKNKGFRRRVQSLDLTRPELQVLGYRKLGADKKSFKPKPEFKKPTGTDLAKYF